MGEFCAGGLYDIMDYYYNLYKVDIIIIYTITIVGCLMTTVVTFYMFYMKDKSERPAFVTWQIILVDVFWALFTVYWYLMTRDWKVTKMTDTWT